MMPAIEATLTIVPSPPRQHLRQHRLRAPDRAEVVGLHHRLEVVWTSAVSNASKMARSSALLMRTLTLPAVSISFRQSSRLVTLVTTIRHAIPNARQANGHLFEQLSAPRREDEIRPSARQLQRRRAADSARCSRDDHCLVFQRGGHETRTHITCYASRRCSGASSFQQFFLALACHHESDLPKLFPLSEARLVSESNKPMRMSEMKGNVAVYDFIFTTALERVR